ncbi:MAG: glycoside hydrolase family 31 protein [Solirubrobacterales bacterium]|nr:glycoside hydrolase family 31 protein [Solirubrobacterales bacterium]
MNVAASRPALASGRAIVISIATLLLTLAFSPSADAGQSESKEQGVKVSPAGVVTIQMKGGVKLIGSGGAGQPGQGLGFYSDGEWFHATRLLSRRSDGLVYRLATDDPSGRVIRLQVTPLSGGGGSILATIRDAYKSAPAEAFRIGFRLAKGERMLGFGERSNRVNQRGYEVENYVGEGPYQESDYPIITNTVPPWGVRQRSDATYFPMPWFISTRGFGFLGLNRETSRFQLGSERASEWTYEADADHIAMRILSGPAPAVILRKMTEQVGRQPKPKAPWVYGPWFQTGHQNTSPGELGYIDILRDADAPVSAAETHMRYMPCGSDLGQESAEKARVAGLHAGGLAALSYTREGICASYQEPFAEAVAKGAFLKRTDGSPYTFNTFVGSGVTQLGMFDFTDPDAQGIYAGILDRAYDAGYDGWMEDYGEYAPPDSISTSGIRGKQLHNQHAVFYHRAGLRYANSKKRPIASLVRSGFTGSAQHSQIVWGGDPTTGWGFDGLESQVTQALTMGLSGVSNWGSDIGGFFSFSPQKLDEELLVRWIQFGAFSGIMRSKAEGIGATMASRPQVWDEDILPFWRRYTKLRTQMFPYLVAANATYRETGMPVMKHLALTNPKDHRATGIEDQYMFGPDLLVSPVLTPGATSRRLYLPKGRWINFWQAISYGEKRGSFDLGKAKQIRGGRQIKVRAPLEQAPVMVKAGSLLPMLPANTDTLAPYAKSRFTGLDDNRRKLHLIAFPRGKSSTGYMKSGTISSREGRRNWQLRITGAGYVGLHLEASLHTLTHLFRPRTVWVGGRELRRGTDWFFNRRSGVLRVTTNLRPGVALKVSAARR